LLFIFSFNIYSEMIIFFIIHDFSVTNSLGSRPREKLNIRIWIEKYNYSNTWCTI